MGRDRAMDLPKDVDRPIFGIRPGGSRPGGGLTKELHFLILHFRSCFSILKNKKLNCSKHNC